MKIKLLKRLRADAKFTYKITHDINVYIILRYNSIGNFSRMLEFNKKEDAIERLNKIRRDYIITQLNKKRDKKINKQLRKL